MSPADRRSSPAAAPAEASASVEGAPVLVDIEAGRKRNRATLEVAVRAPAGTITLLHATPGSGKSSILREVMGTIAERFLVFVPRHDVANEYGGDLSSAYVRRGVTGLRILGQAACVQHDRATKHAAIGLDPLRHLCSTCPSRALHPVTGGPCPAYEDATTTASDSRIRILQSTRAADVLRVAQFKGDTDTIVVFDEPPPVVQSVVLSRATVAAMQTLLTAARPDVRARLGPVVLGVLRGLVRLSADGAASLRDLLLQAHGGTRIVESMIAQARRSSLDYAADGERILSAALGEVPEAAAARLAIEIVREATFMPGRMLASRSSAGGFVLCSRAPWVRALRSWLQNAGRAIILDATVRPEDLKSLGIASNHNGVISGRCKIQMVLADVHVRDAEGVNRIHYYWGSGAKTHHVDGDQPRWSELQGVLRDLASLARREGGPLGLIAHKAVAKAIEAEWELCRDDNTHRSTVFPSEFAALARKGLELRIGWFGNQRGTNKWIGVRVHATVGDPHPNLEAMGAEARLLGPKYAVLDYHRTQAEREQASARARPVMNPVTVVHYGKLKPDTKLAPQWASMTIVASKRGRPRRADGAHGRSADEIATERLQLGISEREHARRLGLAYSTYQNRTRQANRLPASTTPRALLPAGPRNDGTSETDGGPRINSVTRGDALSLLRNLADHSVDSILTDPPYALGTRQPSKEDIGKYLHGGRLETGDFMGSDWELPPLAVWEQCARILKPGGHLLAFGGTRTYPLLFCAIWMAGLEPRDTIAWVHSQGFPKSADIAKAIDKLHGIQGPVLRVERRQNEPTGIVNVGRGDAARRWFERIVRGPASAASDAWAGWGTALKPSHEPILVFRKPLEGTNAENVLKYGVGGMNIDGCRVGSAVRVNPPAANGRGGAIYNMSGMPLDAPSTVAAGRWPANVMLSHASGCTRIGTKRVRGARGTSGGDPTGNGIYGGNFPRGDGRVVGYVGEDGIEEVEDWNCIDGCPVKALEGQKSGAGRFFETFEPEAPPFIYMPKASRSERNADGVANTHACVKPLQLMRRLVRLVTPEGGLVLDPFAGSGSTLVAAVLEGMNFLGIEREEEYVKIAEARIKVANERRVEGATRAGRGRYKRAG